MNAKLNSRVSINSDLTQTERKIQKKVKEMAKKVTKKNKIVQICYQKL